MYLVQLTRVLHKSLAEIEALNTHEIYLHLAYDLTQNKEWRDKYERRASMEKSKNMTAAEKIAMARAALGDK